MCSDIDYTVFEFSLEQIQLYTEFWYSRNIFIFGGIYQSAMKTEIYWKFICDLELLHQWSYYII